MSDDRNIAGYIGSGLSFLFGGLSLDNITTIICGIAGVISALVSIAYTIYKWYKRASSDKKITADEVLQLGEELKPQLKELENKEK